MAWASLTVTDLKERATDKEITVITSAGEDDATDNNKVQGCIDQACALVRGFVGNCDENLPMPTGLKIPDECKWATLAIARYFFLNSVNAGRIIVTEDRKSEYESAMRFLSREVGQCKVAIVKDGGTEGDPEPAGFCYGTETKMDFSL